MNTDQVTQRVADLLKAIAHPHRLAILNLLLKQGPLNGTTLTNQLTIQQNLLSHHLTRLRDLGILASARKGREVYYELQDFSVTRVVELLLGDSSANK